MLRHSFRLLGKSAGRIGGNRTAFLSTQIHCPMEQETLYIKKLSDNATTPVRGSPNAAGYDLFRWKRPIWFTLVLPAHQKALVPTDLSVAIPKNCYGRVGIF